VDEFVKKFRGDEFGRMWPAARAYTKQTHSYHLGKIMTACPEFGTWLNTYHSLLWYRADFNTVIKCDHINNNLAESFNNRVKELKDLPVHDLVDQIRLLMMRLWELRSRIGALLQGDKLPAVVQQVVNRSRKLSHLSVDKASLWGAEVRDTKSTKRHVVDIELKECTCQEWQHTGKPCEHAILFLASKPRLNMHPYLHEYYSVAKFRAAYATPIPALTDQSQWPEVDIQFSMCPPITKRKAGRPKQSRFKAWFEKGGSSKKGKKDKADKPKRSQKATKIDANCVRNLDIELVPPNVVTLRKSLSMLNFLFLTCLLLLFVLVTNHMTCCSVFQKEAWRKRPTYCC
jgi:hypothetical protein